MGERQGPLRAGRRWRQPFVDHIYAPGVEVVGLPGGGIDAIILMSDGEPAIEAVREAFEWCRGGSDT